MKLGRRRFLEVAGAAGSAGLVGLPSRARGAATYAGEEESAVLVDTTLCVGCRGCEAACAEANRLPEPPAGDAVLEKRRETSQTAFTVVNRFENRKDPAAPRYAKRQCLHCLQPACASACPVRALDKLASGPVVYHGERCMGCRYCMLACPFDVPKYEYEKALPYVRKCTFCAERQARGEVPACVSVCPSGALTFGKRKDLLELAKSRIYRNPERYVHHVYGEHEAGGTNWLYLSDVSFEELAMSAEVLDKPYPDLVKGALGVPPFVMTLWPPLLMGLYAFSRRREKVEAAQASKDGSHG
jgi:Fe-S-cluster-containing dehydrogenase component